MHIYNIFDIEPCKDNGYTRIKLKLTCDSGSEKKALLDIVRKENEKEIVSQGSLSIVAYLQRHDNGEVYCENPLVSLYYTDCFETNLSDNLLNKHAFERCINFVKELYELNSVETIESGINIVLPVTNEEYFCEVLNHLEYQLSGKKVVDGDVDADIPGFEVMGENDFGNIVCQYNELKFTCIVHEDHITTFTDIQVLDLNNNLRGKINWDRSIRIM